MTQDVSAEQQDVRDRASSNFVTKTLSFQLNQETFFGKEVIKM